MVPESSVPKGFQVSFPRPSATVQPRCGVTLDGVKRFQRLAPRSRPAPDESTSGGRRPTASSRINRRLDWLRLSRSARCNTDEHGKIFTQLLTSEVLSTTPS
jgi:hypothetical protein